MNKVLFVISAMNGGGAERVISILANHYASQGDEVIILMVAGDESAYPLDPRVRVLSIGQPSRGSIRARVKRLLAMRRFFKAHKEHTIISFGTEINLFTILASIGLKNKVILSERNDPNRCSFSGFRNLIYSIRGEFVFQTQDAKDCFSENIKRRGTVIPNPIRKNLPDPWSGEREKKIAAVGRLEDQKNYGLLLRAFAGFHKRYPEYSLHILGKGKKEGELKELTRKLGIADAVVWEGFKANAQEYIKKYAMYVLSSDYEGIPNALLEALAMGIPCISTDCPIGGPKLCMESGKNGLLVPVGDAGALQTAMEELAENPLKAQEMGRCGIEIRERFSEDTIINMWNEEINK